MNFKRNAPVHVPASSSREFDIHITHTVIWLRHRLIHSLLSNYIFRNSSIFFSFSHFHRIHLRKEWVARSCVYRDTQIHSTDLLTMNLFAIAQHNCRNISCSQICCRSSDSNQMFVVLLSPPWLPLFLARIA